MKWSTNYLKSQLDSFNDHEDDNDYGKDTESSDKEGKHEKRQSSNKGNPTLPHKRGITKTKE